MTQSEQEALTEKTPPYRKLRGYAFDPSLSLLLDTAQVNNIVYKVEWENLDTLPNSNQTVPTGEYIEIIDYDPATGVFYDLVDLNEKYLLAQDGLEPSVSNPKFHQQMVYAVMMITIKNFEAALGRKVQWADRLIFENGKIQSSFVRRLRVYPHALRQSNAYYNPIKKSILFGYFPAMHAQRDLQIASSTVFTCLSHDIIAHETTHAILDGLHRKYIEPTHPDTRAFHEAFADIVALFQHFTFPEVLKHQIAKTRGDLAAQNLLGQLAQEFGKAMGNYGSLRDAIGHTDPETKKWVPHIPNPNEYATKMEFHERGAILVAAIFDAFLSIYKQRIRKLLRVATNGTGVLPDGDLHPDMVDLLSNYASETATRVLRICVRAIDYCPPIDITFGDYLRAIITADADLVVDDERNYRIAFIEAFQKRGILPAGIKTLSVESLIYDQYPNYNDEKNPLLEAFFQHYSQTTFKHEVSFATDRELLYKIRKEFIAGSNSAKLGLHHRINSKFLQSKAGSRFAELAGMLFGRNERECKKIGVDFSTRSGTSVYSIDNIWLSSRVTPNHKTVNYVMITLGQKRGVNASIDKNGNFKIDGFYPPNQQKQNPNGFIFRGGCTLIFDLDIMKLKYAITKDINDVKRMEQQYRYKQNVYNDEAKSTYFNRQVLTGISGPFAFMHSH
jgi:hypothetical protein